MSRLLTQIPSFLSNSVHAVVLPKSLGALTDGSVESPAMHPTPTVGRPPGQRGRKPGRRKTKVTGPWGQKASALGPQSIQPGKDLGPIKIPKKRGPKPGSKVGAVWFIGAIRHRLDPLDLNPKHVMMNAVQIVLITRFHLRGKIVNAFHTQRSLHCVYCRVRCRHMPHRAHM